MSFKGKNKEDKKYKEMLKARDEDLYRQSLHNLAVEEDMEKRFGDYDKDVSVGNMYQRKKKTKKSKAKRKTKKECGCK